MTASGPMLAAAAAALGLLSLGARGMFSPRSSLFGPVLWRGPRDEKARVALTFDDGPHSSATPAVLDLLAAHGIKAAFFVIGQYAATQGPLLRRIDAEGHLLANHSYDHHWGGMFEKYRYWRDQLHKTQATIADAVGREPALLRPPMGFKHPYLMRAARECSLTVVNWSRRAMDGVPTKPERIVQRLASATAGDILALHDGVAPHSPRDPRDTLEALPAVLRHLKQAGLRAARLDELLGLEPYQRLPGASALAAR